MYLRCARKSSEALSGQTGSYEIDIEGMSILHPGYGYEDGAHLPLTLIRKTAGGGSARAASPGPGCVCGGE